MSCNHTEERRGEPCPAENAPCHPTLHYDGTGQGGPSPPTYKYKEAEKKKGGREEKKRIGE